MARVRWGGVVSITPARRWRWGAPYPSQPNPVLSPPKPRQNRHLRPTVRMSSAACHQGSGGSVAGIRIDRPESVEQPWRTRILVRRPVGGGGGCRWKVEYGGRDSGRGAYQALCVVGGREATPHHARNRLASGGALLGVVGSVGEGRGRYSLGGWVPEVDVWSERERREKEENRQISPFWALFLGSPGPGRRVVYLQPRCCWMTGPGWEMLSVLGYCTSLQS